MGDKVYIVAHNLIRAHAKAYRVYHNEFAPTQEGIIQSSLDDVLDKFDIG